MKGIYLIFIFSIISQTLLFSQVVVKRNNQVSKELANVNWSKEYTLFDYTTDEPIFPLIRNGQPVYKIYYASKEDPRPNYGEFSLAQVEGLKYYKFKNRETCFKFCLANKLNAVPKLTTTSIASITNTSATSGGIITSDGGASITSRGIVWSTTTNPTITLNTKTSNGTGTGSFSSSLTNLTPKTTYYVRAYATNSAGTGYGNEIIFTTTDSSTVMGIPCPGTPTVKDIDGNTYNTVQIGTQCWTKENLRVTKYRDGMVIPLDESGGTTGYGTGQTWSFRTTGARTLIGPNSIYLTTYGYLYNWYAVTNTKGLCPNGWYIPSDAEWTTLIAYLGGESIAGGKMKSIGTVYWNSPNSDATNESGFSALPGGYRDNGGSFSSTSYDAFFWSATEYEADNAWYRRINDNYGNVKRYSSSEQNGFSIRCIKDTIFIVSIPTLTTTTITAITTTSATSGGVITSDGGASISARGVVWSTSTNPTISLSTKTSNGTGTGSYISSLTNLAPKTTYYVRAYATNSAGTGYGNEITFTTTDSSSVMGIPCSGTPTVKDIDGNTYNTVQIGTQCWTKENLRVTKYRDGSIIPMDESGGTDGNGIGETWSSRKSGARTVNGHNTVNLGIYGYLYNSYTLEDLKGICPIGWHVPKDSEWTILTEYLGGLGVAGGKMKSIGTTYWISPNESANNESGFSALPSGYRHSNGFFSTNGLNTIFWSAAETGNSNAWGRALHKDFSFVSRLLYNASIGHSLRCIKDTNSIVSIPILTTTAITAITATSSTSGGNITSEGGAASITARGVVWSTSTNPTITLSTKTSNGTGTGSFTSSLTNLTPKTTYYVRAYAINSAGTGYGNEISFTTSDSTIVMGIPCPGAPTVKDIDGNEYNTVQIGTQCWTKENLKVTKYRDGTVIPLDESGGTNGGGNGQTWGSKTTGARTVYGHSAANLANFGYLYNWYAVADTKGLCPSGWHVPSDSEWTTLTTYLGGESVAGGKMKTDGTIYWNSPNIGGNNESGFSILPGGFRYESGLFSSIRDYAIFWSETKANDTHAWYRSKSNIGIGVGRGNGRWMISGASIRCLKNSNSIVSIPTLTTTAITIINTTSATSGGIITSDGGASITARGIVWSTRTNPTIALISKTSSGTGTGSFSTTLTNLTPKITYYVRAYATNSAGTGYGNEITFTTTDSSTVMGIPCPGTPTVKDIDGNSYNTVQIGIQCWTKENLRVTKYRDGSVIPLDESGGTTGNVTGETWSSKATGARTVYGHSAANLATYGYLYNWYAVADSKGLCPSGWHVPLDGEWTILTSYLGGNGVSGGKMKSTGTTYWNSPNIGATNESGFSALPSGSRMGGGSFFDIMNLAFFWSATESEFYTAWVCNLYNTIGGVYRYNFDYKSSGASVRCIKDTNSIVSIPSLTTTEITSITTSSATTGGNITADGGTTITGRGIAWSTSTNPTIALTTKTSNDSGTGSFTSSLTNLAPKTTYYVRAYATNSTGTGYGNEISFTTAEAVMNIPCPGLPTVEDIDGNTYNTVKIGTQCWMKENLRVTKYKDGTPIPMVNDRDNWNYLNNGAWCWYNNDSISFNINHGKLYNWYAATDKQGICPNGWHLGTLNDWNNIINFLEGEKLATIKLKTNSGIWWTDNWTFYEDLSGFSALPSGKRSSIQFFAGDDFSDITYSASFILPEEVNYSESRGITLNGNYEIYKDTYKKRNGASVRCMKDSLPINVNSVSKLTTLALYSDTTLSKGNGGGKILSDGGAQIIQKGIVWSEAKNPTIDLSTKTMDGIGSSNFTSKILNIVPKAKYYVRAYAVNSEGVGYGDEILFINDYTSTMGLPCINYPTVQDIDGNVYKTVQIGTQCWMKENLRVSKYNYGIEIPLDTSGGYWGNEPRQTWTNRKTGARTFFNNDLNNLNKFGYLYNAYVTNSNGGNICPNGWHVPSDGDWSVLTRFLGGDEVAGNKLKLYGSGTNESGFNGLAGGFRENSGNYNFLDAYSYFLSSSKHEWTTPQSSNRIIYAYGSFVFRLANKSDGLSIRCIKD